MCGIVAILQRDPTGAPVAAGVLVDALRSALESVPGEPSPESAGEVARAADLAASVADALAGSRGIHALVARDDAVATLRSGAEAVRTRVDALEARLDAGGATVPTSVIESLGPEIVRLKDALWSIEHDRFALADRVVDLAPDGSPSERAVSMLCAIESALASLDRLEVRGRDSAGLLLLVRDHGLDLDSPELRALLDERRDATFDSFSVRASRDVLAVTYKAAREVGALGQNTRELREKLRSDPLLARLLTAPDARLTVVAHTRWASVGLISEPNAHPLTGEETAGERARAYCAINGDIDNHAQIRAEDELRVAHDITTDSKVLPVLVERALAEGVEPVEAFRRAAARARGSLAIAVALETDPDSLYLSLMGSGQGLYVGLADDCYVVASEPYGVVGMTQRYLPMRGERGAAPGEVVVLDRRRAGTLEGIRRITLDGVEDAPSPEEVRVAEITTRDIDRAGFPHFLVKEIHQSPQSFRKTLRGKIAERDGHLAVTLPEDALSPALQDRLRSGKITRIDVVGQGTASIASEGIARFLARLLDGDVVIRSMPATELSGFALRPDMSDTLVVAVSQSGTTTDTNRAVELVRRRGAAVIGIVNRRNSDLTERCDGIVYTSDGRDVEMSVASTKAFYAQVAAGFLLGFGILGVVAPHRHTDPDHQGLLRALGELPSLMQRLLESRPHIGDIAHAVAPMRRYWATVGNGDNVTAAREVRIKLSELCYKSVACDVTEDKKHIDLSSEPLIVVCAAGLGGPQLQDVKKEIDIFVAHAGAPVVIATQGEDGFPDGARVVPVPETHPGVAFVLSTMAGHLFAYEAALAIDEQARPLREIRGIVQEVESSSGTERARHGELARRLSIPGRAVVRRILDGAMDGSLPAARAVELAVLLRYSLDMTPLDFYAEERGTPGTPSRLSSDLGIALSNAIDDLTRPIDAIRHQAKTVTVGTSRSEEELFEQPLVAEVVAAGVPAGELSYGVLSTLASLAPVVARVGGRTLYEITGDSRRDDAKIALVRKDGVAAGIASRTEWDPVLKGTKRRVAIDRDAIITRGRADGRVILIVPQTRGSETVGLCLLHVETVDRLPSSVARTVLDGYHNRLEALRDTVLESESSFSEHPLGDVDALTLLTAPLAELAERWRTPSQGRERRSAP